MIQVAEIVPDSNVMAAGHPVDIDELERLAGIRVGQDSLLRLNFKEIEKRLFQNAWVESVQVSTRLPNAVSIHIGLKKPIALLQDSKDGLLYYLDEKGQKIGVVDLSWSPDLPVISGKFDAESARIGEAVEIIKAWEIYGVKNLATISEVHWDASTGFKLMILYSISINGEKTVARTVLEAGRKSGFLTENNAGRIEKVVQYLMTNWISASRLFLLADKKIVVRSARGS